MTKRLPRLVLDTNVYISAFLFGGNADKCLDLSREGEINLIISSEILLELAEKLSGKFFWTEKDIVKVIRRIGDLATMVQPKQKLECALAGKADYLVTGDKKHLLVLKSFQGIKIINPAELLAISS